MVSEVSSALKELLSLTSCHCSPGKHPELAANCGYRADVVTLIKAFTELATTVKRTTAILNNLALRCEELEQRYPNLGPSIKTEEVRRAIKETE